MTLVGTWYLERGNYFKIINHISVMYNFVIQFYQFLEKGHKIKLKFLGFILYPLSFHLNSPFKNY